MAAVEQLFYGHVVNKSNEQVHFNDQEYQGKIIGLYFAADWFVR